VREPFGQRQPFAAADKCLRWIAEQPVRLSGHVASTNAGIVPTKQQTMGPMPLGIIKPATGIAMLAACRWLAAEEASRPGGVMRLQSRSAFNLALGQSQEPCREVTPFEDTTCPRRSLPPAVDRNEQLARIRPVFRELVRPSAADFDMSPSVVNRDRPRANCSSASCQSRAALSGNELTGARPRSIWRIASR
jgi:hypothetical protein